MIQEREKLNKTAQGVSSPMKQIKQLGQKTPFLNDTSEISRFRSLMSNSIALDLQSQHSTLRNLRDAAGGDVDRLSIAQEYGEMLPKTGVYKLPDHKVTIFL